MKILSVIYEYPPIGGGGGVVAAALNERLAATGDSVRVVTSHMPGLAQQETLRDVQITRTLCVRRHVHFTTAREMLTTFLPTYRAAARLIKQERPELIHSHFVLPSGLVAWLLSRRFGIPLILTAHGSDIPGYNPDRFNLLHELLKPLWRRIVKSAAAITSPSNYLANLIRSHCPQLPIYIVPNGYTPRPREPREKRKLVLVAARLFPRKGVQHFIEAVANTRSDWEFVIAGDGPYMETLRAQALAAQSPVKFIGFVDSETLSNYYQEAQIFVFPSIRENFPMVLLEAMEAGCAVITTDAEGCAEVVGDAGMVVPSGDAGALRTALMDLMSDDRHCRFLAQRARTRAYGFRWERTAGLYKSVFNRVVRQTDDSQIVRILSLPERP